MQAYRLVASLVPVIGQDAPGFQVDVGAQHRIADKIEMGEPAARPDDGSLDLTARPDRRAGTQNYTAAQIGVGGHPAARAYPDRPLQDRPRLQCRAAMNHRLAIQHPFIGIDGRAQRSQRIRQVSQPSPGLVGGIKPGQSLNHGMKQTVKFRHRALLRAKKLFDARKRRPASTQNKTAVP
ncbi:hypothetical protein VA599_20905 [Chromobacterium sp. TRC.1.1.SA]|uniref:Uncharacterized protein n=1 Tax=Chromobacterium indicum TaxID=3110228 RepID=A0ABV0CPW5_9NEIS